MPELCALAELKMMISASVRPSDNLTLFDEIKWDFYHLETFPHHTDLTWPSLEQSKFVEWCPFPKLASARIEMITILRSADIIIFMSDIYSTWKYYSASQALGPQSDIPPISWSIAASGRWTVSWSHLTLNDSYSEGKKSH